MEERIAIQELSEQLGLTSRTLRHWEAEGLFASLRDPDSGWRNYDSRSLARIHLTALLRRYDIALKDIKKVLDSNSCETLYEVIRQYIDALHDQTRMNKAAQRSLEALLSFLTDLRGEKLSQLTLTGIPEDLPSITDQTFEEEDPIMLEPMAKDIHVNFVTLPPMRAAYHITVSESPEGEALAAVTGWLKEQNLLGTARIFGGDMPPLPDGSGKPYGYGVLASIPESVQVNSPLKEMRVPGGLYAVAQSSDDIGGSWKKLMKYLAAHEEYTPDKSRPCFEEHIRNDAPEGSGHEYFLLLMEPVKKK